MTRNYPWFHSDTARARPSLETSQFLPFQVATIKKRSFANNLASSRVFLKNRVSHVAKPLKRLNRRILRTRITVVLSAHIKSSRSCLLNPVTEKRKWSNKTTLMTMIYYYRKAVIKSRTKSVVIIIRS